MHQRVGEQTEHWILHWLGDTIALPTGHNAYRPHPAVHLPLCESFVIQRVCTWALSPDYPGKHMPGCSSQGQVSVLSGPAASLSPCAGEEVVGFMWFRGFGWRALLQLRSSRSWRHTTKSATGPELCSYSSLRHWNSLLYKERETSNPCPPLLAVSVWQRVSRFPEPWVFLVSRPPEYLNLKTIGPLSNWCLAIVHWDRDSNRMSLFTKAELSHKSSHWV
jgi:hypothetical protein